MSLREHACVSSRGAQSTELVSLYIGYWTLNNYYYYYYYITTHARLELCSYLERLEDPALYCDTDSIIYRHMEGMYNPHLNEFSGGMTDELGESYSTEYVSNVPKNVITFHM